MIDVRSGIRSSGRAADLAGRLPDALAPLARIAYNYRWAWYPRGKEVFRAIDPGRWRICGENPVRLLQEASSEALARAAGDSDLIARAAELEDAFATDLRRPSAGPIAPERPIAFFCAEYGVHHSLPVYSGGLGALAGDLVKEASDQALPLVAVGLLYRQGYFRQRLDASGWQQEYWIDNDPERLPMALVRGPDGEPLTITVPIRGSEVACADMAGRGRSRAVVPAGCRSARERPPGAVDHLAAVRGRSGHPPLAVRAARRRRHARAGGDGDRAVAGAPERGARGVCGARAGA